MITLDQVLLLEQKVESAVAKIQQLESENDALRSKCSELTNALSAKSEQLSSFETDQNKIEQGIRNALDRLNSIENSVLKAAGQIQRQQQTQAPEVPETKPVVQQQEKPQEQVTQTRSFETMQPVTAAPVTPAPVQQAAPIPAPESDENLNTVVTDAPDQEDFDSDYPNDYAEDNSQDDLGFDIF